MNGYNEFEFDLPDALLTSLVEVFSSMASANLIIDNVKDIPDEQGVYQLLLNDQLVYIGKTDGEAGLRKRLTRHCYTIEHRNSLDVAHVTFKAIRVFVFTAVDLETQLIRYYSQSQSVPWNNKGFGSNDPGRNRDDTRLDPASFDATYPLNIDRVLEPLPLTSTVAVSDLLSSLKTALPYTFRHETANGRQPHPELEAAIVPIPRESYSLRALLLAILAALPAGWQATRLAGRVILYREARDYPHGEIIGRS